MKRSVAPTIWLVSGAALLSLLLAATVAIADGSVNSALTSGLMGGEQSSAVPPMPITIYTAKKILTMERATRKPLPWPCPVSASWPWAPSTK